MTAADMAGALDGLEQPKRRLEKRWPAPLGPDALIGFVGDLVESLEPHTESDINAVVIQFLVAFGNRVGPAPFFLVEQTPHRPRLFAVVVGESAKARKGTGWGNIQALFELAETRVTNWIVSGLTSGEGLIWNVRDPSSNGKADDPGVTDKRVLVVESEFAAVLIAAGREKCTLSPVLRDAWDKDALRTLSKNNGAVATNAHVSIIGHITSAELSRVLGETDCFNGFANRFLWVCAQRSKLLPNGGNLNPSDRDRLAKALSNRLLEAREVRWMSRAPEAAALWEKEYARLTDGEAGRFGAITSRAEAQVLRISMVYALLDGSGTVQLSHLKAALEVWRYCEESARYLFGDGMEDPTAERILDALIKAGDTGMTRREINQLLNGHASSRRIESALAKLRDSELAHNELQATAGRPAERWFRGAEEAKKEG